MPTVQLGHLNREAAELSALFADPAAFVRGFEQLLQKYSVPVHRMGKVRGMRPVLPSYDAPPLVLKQIQLELISNAIEDPLSAIALADALWERRNIETRQLAARLLGATPTTDATEITRRLEAWAGENREELLALELSSAAVDFLCKQFPTELVAFAAKSLVKDEVRIQLMGLGALKTLVSKNNFGNLPAVFNNLNQVSADPPKKLRPDLAALITLLAAHSPQETLYFLQQRLAESPTEGTQWVARQVMKSLPEDGQARLREALRAPGATET